MIGAGIAGRSRREDPSAGGRAAGAKIAQHRRIGGAPRRRHEHPPRNGARGARGFFDSASLANGDKKQNEDLIAKNGGRFIETGWRYQGPP